MIVYIVIRENTVQHTCEIAGVYERRRAAQHKVVTETMRDREVPGEIKYRYEIHEVI